MKLRAKQRKQGNAQVSRDGLTGPNTRTIDTQHKNETHKHKQSSPPPPLPPPPPPSPPKHVNANEAQEHIATLSNRGEDQFVVRLFDQLDAASKGSVQLTLATVNYVLKAYRSRWMGPQAVALFQRMDNMGLKPNAESYNYLIGACCEEGGSPYQAMHYFKNMRSAGFQDELDAETSVLLLQIGSKTGFSEVALELLESIKKYSKDNFAVVGNAYAYAMSACAFTGKEHDHVVRLYEEMLVNQYVVPNENLVDVCVAYSELGKSREALSVYRIVSNKDLNWCDAAFCAAIKACGELGKWQKGNGLYVKMIRKKVSPSQATILYLCRQLAAAKRWENLLDAVESMGLVSKGDHRSINLFNDNMNNELANLILSAKFGAGDIEAAIPMAQDMTLCGYVLDNTCMNRSIMGLYEIQQARSVVELYRKWTDFRPNVDAMSAVVHSACISRQYDLATRVASIAREENKTLNLQALSSMASYAGEKKDVLEVCHTVNDIYNAKNHFTNMMCVSTAITSLRLTLKPQEQPDNSIYVNMLNELVEMTFKNYTELLKAWNPDVGVLDVREMDKDDVFAVTQLVLATAGSSSNRREMGLARPKSDIVFLVGYSDKYETIEIASSKKSVKNALTKLKLKCELMNGRVVVRAHEIDKWNNEHPWPTLASHVCSDANVEKLSSS
eukprot:CFRG2116T1